jgi:hypothetical protein
VLKRLTKKARTIMTKAITKKATTKKAVVVAQDLGPIKFPKAIDFYKVDLVKKVKETVVETPVVVVETKPVTKADLARVILGEAYSDLKNVPQRKDIIKRLVEEAKLTPAGAATYLQNYKGKHGYSVKKVPVTA